MSAKRMSNCHGEVALYSDSLRNCSCSLALVEGMCIHDAIVRHTVGQNACLENLLMQLYVNCNRLDDAAAVFVKARDQTASTWNFLVGEFAAQGDKQKAFVLFEQMQLDKVKPSKCTLIRLLSTICSKTDLKRGVELHNLIQRSEFKNDVFVGTALVSMYGRCGNTECAWKAFNEMPRKDVVAFSAMIGILARYGHGLDAIKLLRIMLEEEIKPDRITFIHAFDACNGPSFLEEGKILHELAKENGLGQDAMVASALVNMYSKCGSIEAARKVFDEMPERNLVMWNSMLSAYVKHNLGKVALKMLDRMMSEPVKPDRITFVCAVDACTKSALLHEGEKIHDLIHDCGIIKDIILSNALLNMYGKCGALDRARSMFNELPGKSIVSWNTMIALYAQHNQGSTALELHSQMQLEGMMADNATFVSLFDACVSSCAFIQGKTLHCCLLGSDLKMDSFASSAVVNMYGKCGSVEEARALFDTFTERDLVTWNSMLVLLVRHGFGSNALEFCKQMQVEGVAVDNITLTCLLGACEICDSLSKGKRLHLVLVNLSDSLDAALGTALVRMYGKCGDIQTAARVFNEVAAKDVIAWSAIVAINAQHGRSQTALMQFFKMQGKGLKADMVIFVSVLTACSHYGYYKEALYCFASMLGEYALLPEVEHYVCLIDLFGRAGRLIEAELILNNIPTTSSVAPFLSLLGACRYHSHVDCGERLARHVIEMEYDFTSSYITLSNIYTAAGQD